MGAVVVLVVAIAVVLLAAVIVVVVQLTKVLGGLREAVEGTRRQLQPVLDELNEAGQVTSVELAQLQQDIAELQTGGTPRSTDGDGYTA